MGYVVRLGEEDHVGILDEEGRFLERMSATELPITRVSYLHGDTALIVPCTADVRDELGHLWVVVEFGVVNGQAVCTKISAPAGRGLTGELLRALPLAQLAARTVQANLVRVMRWNGSPIAARFPSHDRATTTVREPRHRLTDEFLAEVARIYREAVAMGLPPAREIERRLGPTASARRWIMFARQRGFLGKARGVGKRGEV